MSTGLVWGFPGCLCAEPRQPSGSREVAVTAIHGYLPKDVGFSFRGVNSYRNSDYGVAGGN